MGKIITYNNPITGKKGQCYCQIKFDNGDRILISQTREGITIFKLFLGIIPIKKIWQINFIDAINSKILDITNRTSFLMDSYIELILPLSSIEKTIETLKKID